MIGLAFAGALLLLQGEEAQPSVPRFEEQVPSDVLAFAACDDLIRHFVAEAHDSIGAAGRVSEWSIGIGKPHFFDALATIHLDHQLAPDKRFTSRHNSEKLLYQHLA